MLEGGLLGVNPTRAMNAARAMGEPYSYAFIFGGRHTMVEKMGRGGNLNLIVQPGLTEHRRSDISLLSAQYQLDPEGVDGLFTCLASFLGYSVPKRKGFRHDSMSHVDRASIWLNPHYAPISVMETSAHDFLRVHLEDIENNGHRKEISFTMSQSRALDLLRNMAKFFDWSLSE